MARETKNACYGCAECIGCGRRFRDFTNLICDVCGSEYHEELYEIDGKELCEDCAWDYLVNNYAKEIVSEAFTYTEQKKIIGDYCDKIKE